MPFWLNSNLGVHLKELGIFTGKSPAFHGYDITRYVDAYGKVYKNLDQESCFYRSGKMEE
jgi:hypothetical protein